MITLFCFLAVLVRRDTKSYRYKYKLPTLSILIFIAYTFSTFNAIDMFRVKRIASASQRAAAGAKTFANPLTLDSLSSWSILLEYLLSTIKYYLTPLIWNASSDNSVFFFYHSVSSIYYFISLLLALIYAPYSFNRKKYLSLMLIFSIIVFFGSYGIADVRIDSAVRHKFQFLIFIYLLVYNPKNVIFKPR
jgi:hypothetical protein